MGLARARKRQGLHDDPNQLILPLFVELDFDEKRAEKAAPLVIEEIRDQQPDYDEWTEQELINLHFNLLEQSLEQALNPRSGSFARKDVVDWIERKKVPRVKESAFSFSICCELAGYNPDDLRDSFIEEMKFRKLDPYNRNHD
jgi:hypothetical protein